MDNIEAQGTGQGGKLGTGKGIGPTLDGLARGVAPQRSWGAKKRIGSARVEGHAWAVTVVSEERGEEKCRNALGEA